MLIVQYKDSLQQADSTAHYEMKSQMIGRLHAE